MASGSVSGGGAGSPAPHALVTVGVVANVLSKHYLVEVICDHEREMDNPRCACSLVNLGWHPSVGQAVNAWIEHVLEVLSD